MAGDYLAICPETPVNNQCPVELVYKEIELAQQLTWGQFRDSIAPDLMICLFIAWGWKKLRQKAENRI